MDAQIAAENYPGFSSISVPLFSAGLNLKNFSA